jgi:hypothetical protein
MGSARVGGMSATARGAAVGGGARFAGNHWRGGHWNGGWRHRGGFGPGFAAGVAIGSAPYWGSGYDDYAYSPDYAFDDSYAVDDGEVYEAAPVTSGGSDDQYCMQRYQSYDPDSGTYLGYDGERHPCP